MYYFRNNFRSEDASRYNERSNTGGSTVLCLQVSITPHVVSVGKFHALILQPRSVAQFVLMTIEDTNSHEYFDVPSYTILSALDVIRIIWAFSRRRACRRLQTMRSVLINHAIQCLDKRQQKIQSQNIHLPKKVKITVNGKLFNFRHRIQ